MASELKECPFCNHHEINTRLIGGFWRIDCEYCGAVGARASDKEGAIAKWNRRASPDDAAGVPVEVREAIEEALSTWVVSTETDVWNGYAKGADADLVQQRSDKVRAWLEAMKGEANGAR